MVARQIQPKPDNRGPRPKLLHQHNTSNTSNTSSITGTARKPHPHRDGYTGSDNPIRCYEDVLALQVEAEDRRLQARAEKMKAESQKHSCIEDNETTPWLEFTKWPELFVNRPIEIITATARLPSRSSWNNEGYLLGDWRGSPV